MLIFANIVGPKQSVPATAANAATTAQKENPSPAQIRDWENSLKQAEAQLEQQQNDRHRQLDGARLMQQKSPLTPEEQLQRAEALSEAVIARQQYEQRYGNGAHRTFRDEPAAKTAAAASEPETSGSEAGTRVEGRRIREQAQAA